MKTLSIRQPWASLIVAGIKNIENRSWPTHYRGPLLIHAGKAKPSHEERMIVASMLLQAGEDIAAIEETLLYGGIIGITTLVDVKHSSVSDAGDWGVDDAFHWHLRDMRPLPFKATMGRLGLFEVEYDL